MNDTEHLLVKSLERFKAQLQDAEATGWYKDEPTVTDEIARIDRALSDMRKPSSTHQLLEAAKLAYRKHHLGDDKVGWSELSEALLDALCEAMGDEAFQAWVDEVKP